MDSLNDVAFPADASGTPSKDRIRCLLRQRLLLLQACCAGYRVLGRYYVAVLLFLVVILDNIKTENIRYNIYRSSYEDHVFDPAVSNWNDTGFLINYYGSGALQTCLQIPGALLIYIISSHKFLTATVAISSVLHMLTPFSGYSGIFEIILLAQTVMEAPLYIAVLSVWKDWAPPGHRTIFVYISLCGWILDFAIGSEVYLYSEHFHLSIESFYITGGCGLCWSLLWFFTIPDPVVQDPLIPENDQLSQRNNTLYTIKRWSKVSEVPWKRIISSMPILALCLISFKIGCSLVILNFMKFALAKIVTPADQQYSLLPFVIVFTVILTGSAVMTDILSWKFPRRMNIRKGIICSALIIHAVLLFGILILSLKVQTYSFYISYIIFSTTLPGFLSNALELSSQYVSIVFGFAQTFCLLGLYFSIYYFNQISPFYEAREGTNFFGKILCYEIVFTIIVAVFFGIWGSLQEQPWSLSIPLRCRSTIDKEDAVEENEMQMAS